LVRIGFPFTLVYKRIRKEKVIVFDPKVFEPCHPKEVAEWQWTKLKTRKFIVHVCNDGRIEVKILDVTKR
jgi:hypothetical protein